MRKLIIVVVGILLLFGSFYLSNVLSNSKKQPVSKDQKIVKTVFVTEVKNKAVPIVVKANGNLVAKNKIELYSEVQGVLKSPNNNFRTGVKYNKGQVLLKADDTEFYASLQSQRSSLQSLIASIMPDIRLDYPNSYQKWDGYLKNFDVNTYVKDLPEVSSEKEKYFITGKNIYTTYYNIKNLEARLTKYAIRAPFNGVLTETSVSNGTLVRSGQKIGEFIDPSVFELTLSVKAEYADLLKVGKTVALTDLQNSKDWKGKVVRINQRVDATSQTVQVFIEVKGNNAKEGMYLEANITAQDVENATEVNRKLLIDNKALYVVKNNKLVLVPINPVYFNEDTVVVKGLKNGMQLVSKAVPGAYEGVDVKIYSEEN